MKTDLFASTLSHQLRAFDDGKSNDDSNVEIPEWFSNMSKEHQEAYLKEHPDSKYAGKAKSHEEEKPGADEGKKPAPAAKPAAEKPAKPPVAKEPPHAHEDGHAMKEIAQTVAHLGKEDKAAFTPEAMAPKSGLRNKLAGVLKSHAQQLVHHVKHDIHEWKHAGKAVVKLAKGGKLDAEDKEAIKSTALDIGVITSMLLLGGGAAHGAAALAHHVAAHAAQEFMLKNLGKTLLHVRGGSLAIVAKGDDDKMLEQMMQYVIEQVQSGKIPPEVAKAAAADAAKKSDQK